MAELEAKQSQLQEKLNVVAERFDRTKERLDEVGNAITEKQAKKEQIERFLAELERKDGVAAIFNKEDIRFTFKDGTEIKVKKIL